MHLGWGPLGVWPKTNRQHVSEFVRSFAHCHLNVAEIATTNSAYYR